MAMFDFKEAATEQVRLLVVVFVFLLTNAPIFRTNPPDLANACTTDLYARIGRTRSYTFGIVFTAAMLLFEVIMQVNMAEDATAKAIKGIASVTAGWKRVALRGMFLLAAGLSFTAFFLVIAASMAGYRYRTGCATTAEMGLNSLKAVALVAAMAFQHGQLAWAAAVSQH